MPPPAWWLAGSCLEAGAQPPARSVPAKAALPAATAAKAAPPPPVLKLTPIRFDFYIVLAIHKQSERSQKAPLIYRAQPQPSSPQPSPPTAKRQPDLESLAGIPAPRRPPGGPGDIAEPAREAAI